MKRKGILILAMVLCLPVLLHAQRKITGTVTDNEGYPMIGVTVAVKGSSTGTTTDAEGYYEIMVPGNESVLVFSFVGMHTHEQEVGENLVLDLDMKEDVQSLDEVVVVGYGTVKRENLTGAVANIRADELEEIPVANLANALEGKLAGVKISTQTGIPGASSTLRIRTESTYGRVSEDVLYVIDGIIYDGDAGGAEIFNSLDATEVESISVLKDAAAAVYGARAAGGVVVVRTRRGRMGKPQISYSGSFGIADATKFPEMMEGYELAEMFNYILDMHGDPDIGQSRVNPRRYYAEDELAHFDSIGNYNWLDELMHTATIRKHTLNVQGGTENFRYFVGGSLYDETGMIEDLEYSKYTFRSNIEANITKYLKTDFGFSYQYGEGQQPNFNIETQGGVLRDTYRKALTAPPWVPLTLDGLPVNNQVSVNPLALYRSGSYKRNHNARNSLNASLEYSFPFVEGLRIRTQFSRSETSGRGKEFAQDFTAYNFPVSGTNGHIIPDNPDASQAIPVVYSNEESIRESSEYGKSYQFNTSLHYDRDFNKHGLSALLVYEQSERESNSLWTRIERAADIPGYDYLWAFANSDEYVFGSATSYSESANLGFVGRLNYSYAEKYLLESTFRYEASPKFHPDHRWGFFPAVSAGWVLSREAFLADHTDIITFAKLRASAGLVGNDNIPAFTWKPTYVAGESQGAVFGGSMTNAIDARNNLVYIPSVRWQESRSYNVGLDTRFLDQISFSMDYYYRFTYNIFNRRENVPTTLGVTGGGDQRVPEENYGEMYAKGIEIEVGYHGRIGEEFHYHIDGNFSWDKHRKLKVIQNQAIVGTWADALLNDPSNQPGYIALGIMRDQEQVDQWLGRYPDYTINGFPLQPGMIYYKDIRGESYIDPESGQKRYLPPDGKITGDDQTIIAEYTSPPYHYGLSLNASWKGISLSTTLSGVFGHKVFISKDEQYTPNPEELYVTNVFSFWSDYWSPGNTDAAYPRPYKYGLEQQNTTFWMRDGHTLRVSDFQLSYRLPESVYSRLKIKQLMLFVSARNLLVLVNPFDHKDPGIARGYDYPLMRSYSFGAKLSL